MTMIDLDTSPLQAAREWRGIGLVAAAMTSGLPMTQAEALEEGDPSAFASIDEMIAAAIVYGATIGIGRDEAVALLDRTVCRTGAEVLLPDAAPDARPNGAFSGAVQGRAARMADRPVESEPIVVEDFDAFEAVAVAVDEEVAFVPVDEPLTPSSLAAELPDVPSGPSPEQAVAASGEIHLDEIFGPQAPWEREGHTGELEAWADDFRDDELPPAAVRVRRTDGFGARVADGTHAVVERVLGTDRADATSRWMTTTADRAHVLARQGREKLRRSEHATLLAAIGGGAVLIALLVAIGGVIGGDEDAAGPGTAERSAATEPEASTTTDTPEAAATEAAAPAAAKPGPMLPPARLTLDVFNAGSQKGAAKTVAAKLEGLGYGIGDVTNAKGSYSGATIIHPRDMAREARVIARHTGITTLQVAPGTTRKVTIVVA